MGETHLFLLCVFVLCPSQILLAQQYLREVVQWLSTWAFDILLIFIHNFLSVALHVFVFITTHSRMKHLTFLWLYLWLLEIYAHMSGHLISVLGLNIVPVKTILTQWSLQCHCRRPCSQLSCSFSLILSFVLCIGALDPSGTYSLHEEKQILYSVSQLSANLAPTIYSKSDFTISPFISYMCVRACTRPILCMHMCAHCAHAHWSQRRTLSVLLPPPISLILHS